MFQNLMLPEIPRDMLHRFLSSDISAENDDAWKNEFQRWQESAGRNLLANLTPDLWVPLTVLLDGKTVRTITTADFQRMALTANGDVVRNFTREVIRKVHNVWNSFSEADKEHFPNFSLEDVFLDPLQFVKLIRADEAILLNLVKNQIFPSVDMYPWEIRVRKMMELRVLALQDKNLFFLPDSIGKLTILQVLNLSYNHLKVVPESIGHLILLRELNLSNNGLQKLPKELLSCTGLAHLSLEGNPALVRDKASLHILSELRKKGCRIDCDEVVKESPDFK